VRRGRSSRVRRLPFLIVNVDSNLDVIGDTVADDPSSASDAPHALEPVMFLDARTIDDGRELSCEVCIIGAGAAGIALARELIGHGPTVIVLESGGMEADLDGLELSMGEQTGLPYFPLETAHLRYFGGSTNHWGGLCRPFDPVDFAPQEWLRNGWPITLGEIEPYYSRSADICGLPVDDWSVDRWSENSRHAAVEVSDRLVSRVALQVPRARRSFGTRFRDELARAENVTVCLHANATEIEMDQDLARATGVAVATLNGRRLSVAARYVVLAAGGIDNPRLLLASRNRSPEGLGNRFDQVGRYFMEHPRFLAAEIVPGEGFPVGFYSTHHAGGISIQGYLALTDEIQLEEGLIDVQLRLRANHERAFAEADASEAVESLRRLARMPRGEIPDDLAGDIVNILDDLGRWQPLTIAGGPLPVPDPAAVEVLLSGSSTDRRALLSALIGHIGIFGVDQITGVPFESIDVVARLAQVPNPHSRITLSDEVDALGIPRPRLHWELSRTDRESTLRTLEILGADIGRAGYGRLRILLDETGSEWPDDTRGGYHIMGTTRMHADARRGVVDGHCRIHGIDNVFVAGSSVFTYGGSGTPTLTIVALALRLADHLKERLEVTG
jgi:choline dehydrogenase-like flavoprotein